jgi:hypothetical protein
MTSRPYATYHEGQLRALERAAELDARQAGHDVHAHEGGQ